MAATAAASSGVAGRTFMTGGWQARRVEASRSVAGFKCNFGCRESQTMPQFVIASEAKQSRGAVEATGLPPFDAACGGALDRAKLRSSQ